MLHYQHLMKGQLQIEQLRNLLGHFTEVLLESRVLCALLSKKGLHWILVGRSRQHYQCVQEPGHNVQNGRLEKA